MSFCTRCGRDVEEDSRFCRHCGAPVSRRTEQFTIPADQLVDRIKGLIREGNVNRIVVKSEADRVLLDIPVAAGAVGTVLFPWMAALGVVAALATRCMITVERKE